MDNPQTDVVSRDLARVALSHETFRNQNCRALVLSDIKNIVSASTASTSPDYPNLVGVAQSPSDLKFTLSGYCDVYFKPSSDSVVLHNIGLQPFLVTGTDDSPPHKVLPRGVHDIGCGQTWKLTRANADGSPIATIQLLPRPECTVSIHSELQTMQPEASKKRLLTETDFETAHDHKRTKMSRSSHDGDMTVIAERVRRGNPLLALQPGETMTTADPSVYSLTMDGVAGSGRNAFTTKIGMHSKPPAKVVVKVLTKDASNAVDIIQGARQWLRETSIMSRLQNENLTKLHSSDARFHTLFIEYEDGKDLSQHIDKDDMFDGNSILVANILVDLLQGLSDMHQQDILHNDLKPENMLHTPGGRTIICDFGLTAKQDSNQRGGGTPYYLAPETLKSGKKTRATDIWALGICMLFFLRRIALPERGFKHYFWLINKAIDGDEKQMSSARAYAREVLATVDALRKRLQYLKTLDSSQADLEKALIEMTLKMLEDDPDVRPSADLLLLNAYQIRESQSSGSQIASLHWLDQETAGPALQSEVPLEASAGSRTQLLPTSALPSTQPIPTSGRVEREEEEEEEDVDGPPP